MDLAIITPSRGRPHNLARLIDALDATCTLDWSLWVGLDDDDPELPGYAALPGHPMVVMEVGPRGSLCAKTNLLARSAIDLEAPLFLASLGDDHRPETPGWDKQLCAAIDAMPGPGWAYGDDLLQGESIPTAWVQSAALVDALGWMMYPRCQHLCVDSIVYDLGHAAGRIAYLPWVFVEHVHPAAGKASADQTYADGNSQQRNIEDSGAYRHYLANDLADDAEKVRALTW